MATETDPYNPFFIQMFIDQLPRWRKFLARYFEKYRVGENEYLDWFYGAMRGLKI